MESPFEKTEASIYKVAPVLIEFEPESTIEMLLDKPQLKVANILPAIIRYCSLLELSQSSLIENNFPIDVDMNGKKVNFAIKYLQNYLTSLENESYTNNYSNYTKDEASVVNTLIVLLAKYDDSDEKVLNQFLTKLLDRQLQGFSLVGVDKQYLLRECKRWNRSRSLITMYLLLELPNHALQQALKVDVNIAKNVVSNHSNSNVCKDMWLQIAKHLIEKCNDIKGALSVLSESDGLLKVEVSKI